MTNDNETPVPHVGRETASKLNRFIEASTEDGLLAVSTPEDPSLEEPPPEEPSIEEPSPEEPPYRRRIQGGGSVKGAEGQWRVWQGEEEIGKQSRF